MGARSDLFWLRAEHTGDATCLRLTGRFDFAALHQLDDAIADARGRDVVLDLAGLTFADDSAWFAVMSFDRRVRGWGRRLRLVNASGSVRKVFEVGETEHLLPGGGGR